MSRAAAPLRKLTPALLRAWPLPDPERSESKEDRGRVLVVGGSRQIPGAALLAASAAMRAGAGKLQVATVRAGAIPMALLLPEAKVMGLAMDRSGEIAALTTEARQAAANADALVLGPGVAPGARCNRIARALIALHPGVVVLDAGALDADLCKRDPDWPLRGMVMTPHAGEMAAMIGKPVQQVEAAPARHALSFAREHRVVLVLKGVDTIIAAPDGRAWINRGGSPGLGTSGSGDVLAGLIAGLAARGAGAEQAAAWAVHLHARAGALLEKRLGKVGLLAREISAEVPALMESLRSR